MTRLVGISCQAHALQHAGVTAAPGPDLQYNVGKRGSQEHLPSHLIGPARQAHAPVQHARRGDRLRGVRRPDAGSHGGFEARNIWALLQERRNDRRDEATGGGGVEQRGKSLQQRLQKRSDGNFRALTDDGCAPLVCTAVRPWCVAALEMFGETPSASEMPAVFNSAGKAPAATARHRA